MIFEKRCSTQEDFHTMFIENMKVSKPFKYNSKEELPLVVWRVLVKKEEKFYKKYGYIDIVYNSTTNVYSRKKVRGRPHAFTAKYNRLTVRLDDEQFKALNNYCQTENISDKSEIIREAIKKYISSS